MVQSLNKTNCPEVKRAYFLTEKESKFTADVNALKES